MHHAAIQQATHVVVAAADAGLVEVAVFRQIEKRHAATGIGGIPGEYWQLIGRIFTNDKVRVLGVEIEVADPVEEEVAADVLVGIQSEAIHLEGGVHPAPPVLELVAQLRVVDIEIASHEVVVIALHQIDVARKADPLRSPDDIVASRGWWWSAESM